MSEHELILKWGTYKSHFDVNDPEQLALIQKYYDFGVSMSAMCQNDSVDQKQALLNLIENWTGKFYLDWDGEYASKEQAKEYILNYDK